MRKKYYPAVYLVRNLPTLSLTLLLTFFILSIKSNALHAAELAHEDVVNINPNLKFHDVLVSTYERNPGQYILQATDATVRARNIYASGLLPAAPSASVRHQNDTIGSNRGEREWEAELDLPVWLPGQREARKSIAKDTQSGLSASRDGLMLQVAGLLRDDLWNIRMNLESVKLYEARYQAAQKLEGDVNRRYQAGELAKTDLMLIQNETLQAETLLLRANTELKHAKHRYIVLTGMNEMPSDLDEVLSPLNEITNQHPIIKEAESKVELAKGERNLVAIERRDNPQVSISARSQRGAFDNVYNDSIGVKLSIPFSSDVRNAPLLAAAETNLAQYTSEREKLMQTIQTSFHEAEHNLGVTEAEIKIVSQQNQITQDNLKLAKVAFNLGETDLVNLMRVQALAFESERAVASKKIQLKWDVSRYNQAVGVLP